MPVYDKKAVKEAQEYLDALSKIEAAEDKLTKDEKAKKIAAAYDKLKESTKVIVDNIGRMSEPLDKVGRETNKLGSAFSDFQDKTREASDTLGELPNIIQKSASSTPDLSKGLNSVLNISQQLLESGGDYSELTQKQIKLMSLQLSGLAEVVTTSEAVVFGGQKQQEDLAVYINQLKETVSNFDKAQKKVKIFNELSKATGGALDPIAGVIKDISDRKFAAGIAAAFTIAANSIAKVFEENIKQLQKLGTGVTFAEVLKPADLTFKNLLLSTLGFRNNLLEAQTAAKLVAGSLEAGNNEALATNRAAIALSTGIDVSQIAQLEESFVNLAGLSRQAAAESVNTAIALSNANDVSPTAVLQDMATNAEALAKFSDGTAEGMAKAAIQAARLGMSISDATSIAKGLLDIESSLTAEFEASVLLGRNLNFDRARSLALNNDIVGLQQEITRQLGNQQDFANMNILQREALAEALNIDVGRLAQIMARQDRADLDQMSVDKQILKGTNDLVEIGLITNGLLKNIFIGIGALGTLLIGSRYAGNIGRFISKPFQSLTKGLRTGKIKTPVQDATVTASNMRNRSVIVDQFGRPMASNTDAIVDNTKSVSRFSKLLSKLGKLKGAGLGVGALLTASDVAFAEEGDKVKAATSGIISTLGTIGASLALGASVPFILKAGILSGVGFGLYQGTSAIFNAFDGQMAEGGPVQRSGSYLVGEYGPEIVELKRGSMVHSNADIKGAMAEGAGSGLADIGPLIAEIRGLKEQMRMVVNNTGDTAKGVGNISIATS